MQVGADLLGADRDPRRLAPLVPMPVGEPHLVASVRLVSLGFLKKLTLRA
jgi:hypothetical protein